MECLKFISCNLFILLTFINFISVQGGVETKTSSSRLLSWFGNVQTSRECLRPLPPDYGTMRCLMDHDDYKCTGECDDGYIFPSGFPTLSLKCDKETGQWTPHTMFPSCARGTGYEDEYEGGNGYEYDFEGILGGYGLASSKESEDYGNQQLASSEESEDYGNQQLGGTRYEDDYEGNLGGYGSDICLDRRPPVNGIKQCSLSNGEWRCQISCVSGYQFPDGNTKLTIICQIGVGVYEPIDTFEECLSSSKESEDYGSLLLGNYGGYGPAISGGGYGEAYNSRSAISGGDYGEAHYSQSAISGGDYGEDHYSQSAISGGDNGEDQYSQSDLCPSLSQPTNAGKLCRLSKGEWMCQVSCMTGFQFPDGNTEVIVKCNSRIGRWSPSYTFEDCKDISGSDYGHGY